MDLQVQLVQCDGAGGEQPGPIGGVDEHFRHAFFPARGMQIKEHHQRTREHVVVVHRGGDVGDLHRRVTQKELVGWIVPKRQGFVTRDAALRQGLEGPRRACGDPVLRLRGLAGRQCEARLDVELIHEGGAPTVPQARIGGRDVRYRERVQVVQARLRPDAFGERLDDDGIVDVLALRGRGHDKVVTHQPSHQFGVVGGEAVALAECDGVERAEFRVVSAPALADVVKQSRKVKQFDLRHVLRALRRQGKAFSGGPVAQASEIFGQHDRMRVDGIDVEQIVLHLAHDPPELGDIASEHAVAPHSGKLRVRRPEKFQEIGRRLGIAVKVVIDQFQIVADATHGLRADPGDVRPIGDDEEHFYQCGGVFPKHLR